ncbi:hypothetical protein AAFF_G00074970 [Aldrovandia affinis]|uniref:Uncharacterized protein n=1 Tax=Aldrovandia affinis TaxID=143900 RepID=A0AAD7RXX1_9TELE|nr:hypothetical protein AAFF_G00074970 [Aldrovandia affinis]
MTRARCGLASLSVLHAPLLHSIHKRPPETGPQNRSSKVCTSRTFIFLNHPLPTNGSVHESKPLSQKHLSFLSCLLLRVKSDVFLYRF